MQDQITSDHAWAAAEALLGRRPDRLEAFAPTVGGDDAYAWRLWADRQAMLLKIQKRPGIPVGVYFHERIAEAGVPVPELIAFDAHAGPGAQACAIWEWIDGQPAEWRDPQPCPYDEAELGELLRRIHSLTFEGDFGFLGDDLSQRTFPHGRLLPPTSETWAGFFRCELAGRHYFEKGYLDRREADVLASLPNRLSGELARAQKRLLHMGDIMHNGNMLIDPATRCILAVVDYTDSMAGDPRWELACVDYYFDQFPYNDAAFDLARFRAGYGADHDPNDRLGRFYLAAILAFYKLAWFPPGQPRTAWAIETLTNILAEFGS